MGSLMGQNSFRKEKDEKNQKFDRTDGFFRPRFCQSELYRSELTGEFIGIKKVLLSPTLPITFRVLVG